MSDGFTKVRMLYDKDYAHYKSHVCSKCANRCNQDRAEINDELNEKYSNSVLRDDASETFTSEYPAESNSKEVEQESNNAAAAETVETFVNDNPDLVSSNAERVILNQQDMNASLDEVSNDDVAKNVQQVLPQTNALSAANLTPPPIPAVIAQNKVPQVYNCRPAEKRLPGKPVLGSKIQPYKCRFCKLRYSTPNGVKRHSKKKHPNSTVSTASTVEQPTESAAPVVAQPMADITAPDIPLIEINGTPLDETKENSVTLSDDVDVPPFPDDDVDFEESMNVKPESMNVKPNAKTRRSVRRSGIILTPPEKLTETKRALRSKKRRISDSDEEETSNRHKRFGRGGNFYCSWD